MLFIGFPTLEGLLEDYNSVIGYAADNFPLYALSHSLPSSGSMGITRWSARITVSFLDEDSVVHYWTMPLGATDYLNGTPMADDEVLASRRTAQDAAWNIIADHLRRAGYIVVEALVAVPKDLALLDGRTDLLEYDKASKTYRPRAGRVVVDLASGQQADSESQPTPNS